jgi:ferric-dicitrate binding protein FerR (iron transport regulator)
VVTRLPFSSGTTGARLMLADGSVIAIDRETVMSVTERDGTTILVDSGGMDYHGPVAGKARGRDDDGDNDGDDDDGGAGLINEVSTPSGMEFPVTLSDGTRVRLNAESRLHFPTRFTGGAREVVLEGEAFFKVTSDAARPFIVHAAGVEVRVTGTEFNLRAYDGERAVAATLVEGKVTLASGDREWALGPGTQARYDKAGGECVIRAVDTDHYTAWQSGRFIFRNERLEEVLDYLSRWYGFEYEFLDDEARDVLIGAHLNRYADMGPIIQIIEETRLARVSILPDDKIIIRSYQ